MTMRAALSSADAAVPRPYRVMNRWEHTSDTVTLELSAAADSMPAFAPGQFAMLTAFGIGEVPISLSGLGDDGDARSPRLRHTVRAVGAVTTALYAAQPGQTIGVRGPFGTSWDVSSAVGADIVVVAGGIGLAPLRPVLLAAIADRARYSRIVLLLGARSPDDVLYQSEFESWRHDGIEIAVTVDQPNAAWTGEVGLVTALIKPSRLAPERTMAFLCGPDVMMRLTAEALVQLGIPASRIRLSVERNMRCGAGWCGHCQFGPMLVCRDGAVVSYETVAALMRVREL